MSNGRERSIILLLKVDAYKIGNRTIKNRANQPKSKKNSEKYGETKRKN
jgi:hypothetical protein